MIFYDKDLQVRASGAKTLDSNVLLKAKKEGWFKVQK